MTKLHKIVGLGLSAVAALGTGAAIFTQSKPFKASAATFNLALNT